LLREDFANGMLPVKDTDTAAAYISSMIGKKVR